MINRYSCDLLALQMRSVRAVSTQDSARSAAVECCPEARREMAEDEAMTSGCGAEERESHVSETTTNGGHKVGLLSRSRTTAARPVERRYSDDDDESNLKSSGRGHRLRIRGLPFLGWLGSRVVSVLDSGAEGPRFKSQLRRCRVTVLGKLFTPIVPLPLFTKQRNC